MGCKIVRLHTLPTKGPVSSPHDHGELANIQFIRPVCPSPAPSRPEIGGLHVVMYNYHVTENNLRVIDCDFNLARSVSFRDITGYMVKGRYGQKTSKATGAVSAVHIMAGESFE